MKYYTLTVSDNLDTIGTLPQVVNTDDNLFGSPFSPIKINYGEIPEEIPFLELEFEKNAKITDLLSTYNPSFGLLVSGKFKKIILNFKLTANKFYPISLLKDSSYIKNYYWFNFYDNLFPYIDMNKSKFSIQKNGQKIECSFESKEFFKKKERECLMDFSKTFKVENLYLLNTFPKYDLFEFENFTFISEILLESLIKNNITGYKAKESKILFV
ncbi:hypothetical protein KRX57_07655 [Weeksellaceae bacterium TAE3-ERU29]|nr:hypothetical protein [Weeksellaceae bacterium TAE3-ERU29]